MRLRDVTVRPVAVEALRQLVREARAERATLDLHSPARGFYLGVEAAAEEVLRPELAAARPADWPGREAPAFRSGYLETTATIAAMVSSDRVPMRVRLPQPRPTSSR